MLNDGVEHVVSLFSQSNNHLHVLCYFIFFLLTVAEYDLNESFNDDHKQFWRTSSARFSVRRNILREHLYSLRNFF